MRKSLTFLTSFLLVGCSISFAQSIPDLQLRLAVQQNEDGKIGSQVHYLELVCDSTGCVLTSVTLGKCDGVGSPTFPIVEISSTGQGNLKVVSVSENSITVEENNSSFGGVSRINYMFEYTKDQYGLLYEVTGFSGGFVKNSDILKKVITVNYVPFEAEANGFPKIKNCEVAFPGVVKK